MSSLSIRILVHEALTALMVTSIDGRPVAAVQTRTVRTERNVPGGAPQTNSMHQSDDTICLQRAAASSPAAASVIGSLAVWQNRPQGPIERSRSRGRGGSLRRLGPQAMGPAEKRLQVSFGEHVHR